MSFVTQLLKGCVMLDVVKVVDRYLVPRDATFEQICKMGLVENLLEYCQSYNPDFDNGIGYACQIGYLEIVKFMINNGADITHGFCTVCRFGNDDSDNDRLIRFEIINLLINNGAIYLELGFRIACESGQLEIVKFMIEKGVNNWNYGLWSAGQGRNHGSAITRSNRMKIIELMIEAGGASVSGANKGATILNDILSTALFDRQIEIVNLIKKKGLIYYRPNQVREIK
jgi:ankyrin repeat protein